MHALIILLATLLILGGLLACLIGCFVLLDVSAVSRNYKRVSGYIRGRRNRATAFNAVMLPFEVDHRGTDSMFPDTGVVIAFRNSLVKTSTDDRHFTNVIAQGDIPRGVLLNDEVGTITATGTNEANTIKKAVGIFGIYPGTLPGVASAAIPRDAELVADPANPGQVIALPAAAGTYIVFGRARFAVINPGDPVSIIHTVPRAVSH